mgnify:FL=1
MEYLIKIDYSRLKDKDKYEFIERFNGQKFDKYIVNQNDNVAIVKLQIFDYLIFDIETIKKFTKNLRLSLLSRDEKKKSKNIKIIYDDIKVNTDEYNELIRQIRF